MIIKANHHRFSRRRAVELTDHERKVVQKSLERGSQELRMCASGRQDKYEAERMRREALESEAIAEKFK